MAVKAEFEALCQELNMDALSKRKAWEDYESIKENYSLEGNQMHWLACSLYVACRNMVHSTIGDPQGAMRITGNGLSLTRLLRASHLSLVQFFNKAKKWADMFNLKKELRYKIDRLERNFAVSNVIFKKYQPIFVHLFKDPSVKKGGKKKSGLSPAEVFDFTWGLFVRVKADFPAISDDLVNSYHLLLSCVDHIYGNALLSHKNNLLNPVFQSETTDILDSLCRTHEGILSEVKSIREHYWKPHIKQFIQQKTLKGDPQTLSGLLDPGNYEHNSKAIRKEYEAYVLSIGEYDERVFLGENAVNEAGTPTKCGNPDTGEPGEKIQMARRNLVRQFDGNSLIPNTPLSGKHYLKAKDQLKITPVSTATYLVSRLNNLIGKREAEPSSKLLEFFKSCDNNPAETIAERVKRLGDIFSENYTARSDKHPGSQGSFARMRLKMGVILYYKLLERILMSEKEKGKPIGNLLDQNQFHCALFACCLEVVIFSYNSQRTFPWILDTFGLESIQFYKVIEIIIRNEDALPRDVVKHLQRIEEQILESRAWVRDSALWEEIEKDGRGVPSCEEVALPNNEGSTSLIVDPIRSPMSNQKQVFAVIKSPMAVDRFKSPVVNAIARRQLFLGPSSSPVNAGQSLLFNQEPLGNPSSDSVKKVILASPKITKVAERPKRTGSLGLFFRKVYHLSYLRLDQLCFSLQIADEDIKRKIWTTFEYTLKQNTDLMKDRHLDQLLMCSLYIVCKVVGSTKYFTDIMKHYRTQPQAASHVYRSVLLRPRGMKGDVENESSDAQKSITPPTPTRLAASSTIAEDGEERGDLIKFYNTVFMERLQEFSLKFKRSRQSEAPPLSPLPKLRANPQSPCKKVSENQRIFIRPLKTGANEVVINNSPHKPLLYNFNRSPAKNLNAINELMREVEKKSTRGKRLLAEEDVPSAKSSKLDSDQSPIKLQLLNEPPVPPPLGTGGVNNKLELILGDRSQM
uniref:Retinoblastomalike protein 1like [Bombus impatiens] n=1 Tax=Lepeophtheirus salmonis TaxID=72036 RepID=A0A0K2TLX7_LEPSM